MAKSPPKKPKKNPARPTRSKAARPDAPPTPDSLAELLNPAIGKGTAGVGSGTGLQPPPESSWERRQDFSAAHKARKSAQSPPKGFGEAPQADFDGPPVSGLDPALAEELGLTDELKYRLPKADLPTQPGGLVGLKSQESLERLLREGRAELSQQPWTPHRPPRPEKSEGGVRLKVVSDFEPKGDQPQAIKDLVEGVNRHDSTQVLLGVTGSGKTFTMAKVIEATQRPAIILAPNKTLAAQLYGEFKSFFPDNAVEYFVSYYDYYQPEAYVPRTDTYIEKESSINEQIDRMRHSATRALLERDDVIIVASVSCIYGIGSVETYSAMTFTLKQGGKIDQRQLIADLVALQYKRTQHDFARGTFRVRGDVLDLFPAHYEDRAWRIHLFGDEIEKIEELDPLTGRKTDELEFVKVYANSHYVTPRPTLIQAMQSIKQELRARLDQLNAAGRLLEAQRLEQRTIFDLEMMEATGACAGIENYSRYLTGRKPGEPPPTLFEYVPDNALVFVDESHVTIPQLGGMYRGDFRRKATLAEYGFRLPSCMDNRPLRFEEWDAMRPQTLAVSATPGNWELEESGGVFVEQVIRPTGLIDPPVEIRPARTQVDDLVGEVRAVAQKGYRSLVTVLTKRMAEDLTEYLHEQGIRVRYMHSDIDTLERIEIIRDLRLGAFDALVGINLLREGLDIPECALVAILDADKEGFLRSETSLIQTIGRAARNVDGKVLLYADHVTGSMQRAMEETGRRREKQVEYNTAQRHHAGKHQALDPRHSRQRLRARPRADRHRRRQRRVRRRRHHRPQSGSGGGRPGNAHARGRQRSRLRRGRAPARRDQAAEADRTGGARRPDGEAAFFSLPLAGRVGAPKAGGAGVKRQAIRRAAPTNPTSTKWASATGTKPRRAARTRRAPSSASRGNGVGLGAIRGGEAMAPSLPRLRGRVARGTRAGWGQAHLCIIN